MAPQKGPELFTSITVANAEQTPPPRSYLALPLPKGEGGERSEPDGALAEIIGARRIMLRTLPELSNSYRHPG